MRERLKSGFTTGSCAAACAYAACYTLLSGRRLKDLSIVTPAGREYRPKLTKVLVEKGAVTCFVRKESGDDPDATRDMPVGVRVSRRIPDEMLARPELFLTSHDLEGQALSHEVYIDGGKGVGRVTRAGLDQPVGAAAINRVPRHMIAREICRAADLLDEQGPFFAQVILPEGERIARSTFNPRLGIVGGLSVLGTTGIVEPMSEKALLDTIYVEMKQHAALGERVICLTPGNYGRDFLRTSYGYDLDASVKISNYVGESVDMAVDLGFEKLLLTGHIGKLVKLAGGIMNTHSRMADCRLELMAAAGIRQGLEEKLLRELLNCVTTEAACELLQQEGKLSAVMNDLMERISYHLNRRADGKIQIEVMTYADAYGCLARTKGVDALLKRRADPDRVQDHAGIEEEDGF
ncbi:putative cobalamin biosynthesis protein CbiD [Shuttleworthella sp. MSX8B]|uniref:cobalt-precorrin-5B (C(1))-methyltransferase CbiD n=1 Tax=Shuttleworthella sp. MSX8B TaxID=936574 RepID=UPI000445942E|nr:cobalt-precorrin-5B (C(1))-methyltransferase CbiD [Shuttleworthia sp. MSX8B]EUB17273.1 putative cobalamin biosynthesis protein CbiD [Shuttleworthia sp. MSX8B]